MAVSKLILTHEVTGLGEPGDVVEVKSGYARNYLIPRNLATPWTKGYESQVGAIRKARKARRLEKEFSQAIPDEVYEEITEGWKKYYLGAIKDMLEMY